MPVSIRPTFQTRLAQSKAEVEKVKKSVVSIFSSEKRWADRKRDARAESNRAELLSGSGYRGDDPYHDDDTAFSTRTRLLAGTETLTDSSRRLENAQRVALETEDVGTGILHTLRGQREQLENSRNHLLQADGSIDRASGTLKKMIRK